MSSTPVVAEGARYGGKWRRLVTSVLFAVLLGWFLYWFEGFGSSEMRIPAVFGGFVLGGVSAATRVWWLPEDGSRAKQWLMIGIWFAAIGIPSFLDLHYETLAIAAAGIVAVLLCESAKEFAAHDNVDR